ncbi:hypothetical protein GWK48_02935 [Metallosphaera tengchongensis]|uniref:Uncharacterized protein n=1 Tax=Metallosphaera tengchongensis TaxID=1532350 RepID=A0A6N0NRV3_9CREN|nr:hypothetical protein [Metallosphaera tengchongensis]QKQ99485.1 hypothetical protein GWK48_02935 [Metallosphaera tengchongensis]
MKNPLIVDGERDKVQMTTPKADKVTSIDIGIKMLATVTVDDVTVLLYVALP